MNELPAPLRRLTRGLADPRVAQAVMNSHPRQGGRAAAILILIATEPEGAEIVFIEKTEHLRKHAGQVAFPGGAIEPGDTDPIAAALREAEEEVGVRPTTVRVLGTLPVAHVRPTGFDVTPVVGQWLKRKRLHPADPEEVAAVHQLKVADLVDPANRSRYVHPFGFTGPAFQVGGVYIWGFTGMLLDGLLDLAGWSRPWDPTRETPVPDRLVRDRP